MIRSLTTQQKDGNLRLPANLRHWLGSHGWPTTAATGKQVHGNRVQIVPRLSQAKEYPDTDGFLTIEAQQPLGIFTADCLPIFIADLKIGAIGALHAGWRGVRGEILKKAVGLLQKKWGSQSRDIRFWFGPCIQPCCFEVQWDVAKRFPYSRRRIRDRWRVDLPKEVRQQARQLGLREDRTKTKIACTMHERRYFSFRRDQAEGRQISLIMKVSL